MSTIEELKIFGARKLQGLSPTPRLDSEILLGKAIGMPRIQLISHNHEAASSQCEQLFTEYIERRRGFEPVAYITGVKEFWGLEFEVDTSVLIPRPETELLVEEGLKELEGFADPLKILDLGTGSGCLAVALAFELLKAGRRFEITAVDLFPEALEIARRNAARHGVLECIKFGRSDWFSELRPKRDLFQLIVCNPPYVSLSEPHVSPEISFEPQGAIYAGEDGLNAYRVLCRDYQKFLASKGVFIFEAGAGQAVDLEDLFSCSDKPAVKRPALTELYDLAGHFRACKISKI